jgi:hypothetical protein
MVVAGERIMDKVSRRPLTQGEKRLVEKVFGTLDLERVRLCDGDGGNPFAEIAFRFKGVDAVTLVRTIFFQDRLAADFSAGGDAALFLHEMTHIWQVQTLGVIRFGLRYLGEFVTRGFNRDALYTYDPGKTVFAKATLEAQAQMVQHYASGGDRVLLAVNLAGSGLYDFKGT